jgi:hypothetical protein
MIRSSATFHQAVRFESPTMLNKQRPEVRASHDAVVIDFVDDNVVVVVDVDVVLLVVVVVVLVVLLVVLLVLLLLFVCIPRIFTVLSVQYGDPSYFTTD